MCHTVPFCFVDPVAGLPIDIPLVGRDAHVGHAPPGREVVDGDIGAEASDHFRAVQSEAHDRLL